MCLLLACSEPPAPPPEPALPAPDPALEAYVEAFDPQAFEVRAIPGVGRFYLDDERGLVEQALREGRPHSAHLIAFFDKYARPGSTALDLGAHIGSLTVPLARRVGPEGRV